MRMERCGMFLSCKVLEGLSRMTCSDLGGPESLREQTEEEGGTEAGKPSGRLWKNPGERDDGGPDDHGLLGDCAQAGSG